MASRGISIDFGRRIRYMKNTKVAKAFCARMDHGGCAVLVEIDNGRIKRISGDPDCPTNQGKLCPKGKAAIDLMYHPDRITSPLKRTGARGSGAWTKITWEEALDTIAGRIKTYRDDFGPQAIAFAEGAPRGLEYLFTYRLAAALGTPNVVTTGAVCFAPRWGAALVTCGFYPKPDVENSQCIMAWGENHLDTSADSTMGFQVQRAMRKGLSLIVIDPRKTTLAAKADLWLRGRPGTDGALALAMVHVIINEGLYDESFVSRWVSGFDQLKGHLVYFTPERVSEITWIPADLIRKAARMYAKTKPASLLWGNALEHNINSVQVNRALVTLMAITGNLDTPGGNVDCGRPPVRSPGEFMLAHTGKRLRDNMIGAHHPLAKMRGFVPGSAAIHTLLTDDPYPVKMMLAHTTNPMASYANSQRVFAALSKLDFLVVTDLFMTPTAALADVVLPAAFNYEFNDLGHYGLPWGSVHARPKLIDPPGQCWSDIKIMNELGKRVGLGEYFWDDVDDCLDYILEPSGLDFESFKRVRVLEAPREHRKYEQKGFRTPSGKIELYAGVMEKWGVSPLPDYSDPDTATSQYPILLTSHKDRAFFHTFLRNVPALRKLSPIPTAHIHPDLAGTLALAEGDTAVIETDRGSIQQQVKLDASIEPRVAFVDYGWWLPENGNKDLYGWQQSNVNILTSDHASLESTVETTMMRAMGCNIRRVSGQM